MTVDIYLMGKVTASKSVLNNMAGDFVKLVRFYDTNGNDDMRDIYNKRFTSIFDALDAVGYYDDNKND